ncbi:hypothetical protein XFF6166_220012 [Xanthomonas citri pv. fuscans]|nr:hypothetical protein XFF6166_220012 [Xanthomonas citri pv. fuscans]SOO14743.1 hypothetical protein XFF7766_360016 [Xanthomonas citri pv. fuscans]SOO42539.1 hypothetical protein XFF1815_210016 [Xanthomonas citri pv. fuscans]
MVGLPSFLPRRRSWQGGCRPARIAPGSAGGRQIPDLVGGDLSPSGAAPGGGRQQVSKGGTPLGTGYVSKRGAFCKHIRRAYTATSHSVARRRHCFNTRNTLHKQCMCTA